MRAHTQVWNTHMWAHTGEGTQRAALNCSHPSVPCSHPPPHEVLTEHAAHSEPQSPRACGVFSL